MEVAAEVGAWTTLGMEDMLGQSANGSLTRWEGAAGGAPAAVSELSVRAQRQWWRSSARGAVLHSAAKLGVRGGGKEAAAAN